MFSIAEKENPKLALQNMSPVGIARDHPTQALMQDIAETKSTGFLDSGGASSVLKQDEC